MLRKSSILLLLFFVLTVKGQDKKKDILALFEKSKQVYESNKNMFLTTRYALYSNFSTTIPKERYSGFFIRKGGEYYSKIGTTEIAFLKDYQIVVDNGLKRISISEIDKDLKVEKAYDMTRFCEHFNKFSLTSEKNNWVCTLTAPKITFAPYGKVVVYVDKSTYRIAKQVVYLLKRIKGKDKKGNVKEDFPRIETEFVSYKNDIKEFLHKFSSSQYILRSNEEIIASNNYRGYKIID